MMGELRDNIKRLLAERDWNEYHLQDASGVPQSTLNRFLNGEHSNMMEKTVRKIAKGFGITEAELRYGEVKEDTQSYVYENIKNSNNIQGNYKVLFEEIKLSPDLIANLSGIREHGLITAIYMLININTRGDRYETLSEVIRILDLQRESCKLPPENNHNEKCDKNHGLKIIYIYLFKIMLIRIDKDT
jgi:transcriptional regulator with XRE-family HTH domain